MLSLDCRLSLDEAVYTHTAIVRTLPDVLEKDMHVSGLVLGGAASEAPDCSKTQKIL